MSPTAVLPRGFCVQGTSPDASAWPRALPVGPRPHLDARLSGPGPRSLCWSLGVMPSQKGLGSCLASQGPREVGGLCGFQPPNRCLTPSIQTDSGRRGRWRAAGDRAKESEAFPITELRSGVLPWPHTSEVGAPHQSSVPGIQTPTFVFTHQRTLSRVQGTQPPCLTHLTTRMLWRQCLD